MKEKTIFIAFDGKEFTSAKECIEYERTTMARVNNTDIMDALETIKGFCQSYDFCESCPFSINIESSIIGSQCYLRHSIPQQ
jgi:hypothetical protein